MRNSFLKWEYDYEFMVLKELLMMGKKVRKTLSNGENCSPRATEKTITLESSCDTDIIECSIESENGGNFIKKGQCRFKNLRNIQLQNTPVQSKESPNTCRNFQGSNSSLRSYKQIVDKVSEETAAFDSPCPIKSNKERNSIVKKLISTLKKTPEGPYLSVSKLRNIEQWLRENEVEVVQTPPFANLSITPKNPLSKRFSSQWKDQNLKQEDSSIDSDVEGVLKAVYGEDWQKKNVQTRARTEPKKKTKGFFSPVSQTQNSGQKNIRSVRRNILKDKKLNLSDDSDEENNFDESFLSGIKMINLDGSNDNDEHIKASGIRSTRARKKYEGDCSDLESLHLTPVQKKKPGTVEKKNRNVKTSTGKKYTSNVAFKTPKKTFLASLSVSTPTSKCHPDAQYYKINFKSKKEELVKKLYKLYNSEVFDCKLAEDMNFSWNVKLRGTAGYCYNKRVTKSTGEVLRVSRVEFSTKIVDRADRLRDTMIHELCHAASWVIDGVLDGHGEVWSKWATKAMDRFSELPTIKRCHNYDIVSKYVYRCTGCGYSIKRHSKSINTERKRCGYCYGVLELLINKKRRGKGEVPQFDTTRTLPTPNKFAMFVKENYHSVKSSKLDAKHSEIMKILSEKYAFIKSGPKSAKKESHQ